MINRGLSFIENELLSHFRVVPAAVQDQWCGYFNKDHKISFLRDLLCRCFTQEGILGSAS